MLNAAVLHGQTATSQVGTTRKGIAAKVEGDGLVTKRYYKLVVQRQIVKQSDSLTILDCSKGILKRCVLHLTNSSDIANRINQFVVLVNSNLVGINRTVVNLCQWAENPSLVSIGLLAYSSWEVSFVSVVAFEVQFVLQSVASAGSLYINGSFTLFTSIYKLTILYCYLVLRVSSLTIQVE